MNLAAIIMSDMKHMKLKVKSAIIHNTSRSTVRGIGSVFEFWPNRVIMLGGQNQDRERLAEDWKQVGNDIRKSLNMVINGGR